LSCLNISYLELASNLIDVSILPIIDLRTVTLLLFLGLLDFFLHFGDASCNLVIFRFLLDLLLLDIIFLLLDLFTLLLVLSLILDSM
jgi:hypothetical protein